MLVTVLSLLVVTRTAAQAQTPSSTTRAAATAAGGERFTAEDALGVTSYTAADLSRDGHWLAATSTVRRDNFGVDFRRDGDPTYIRPSPQRILVIDTRTGASRAVLPDTRTVRALRWSPDGRRLGMLLLRGDRFEPVVWDRESGRLTTGRVPEGRYVAETSELRWTPDGTELVFALHTLAWRQAARDSFAVMTSGPVFVQSSTEPYLAWEALRRSANAQSVVALDVRRGTTRELLPETRLTRWELAEDGSVVTYAEDVTKKTDYDAINGTETKLMARQVTGCAAPCEARTLLPAMKGVTVVWSDDGKRFAYGREGRVYVATVMDTVVRQVAGAAPAAPRPGRDTVAADTSKAARERQAAERFTPVRYSPVNDALVVSNREGLWLLDLASGARDLIVATADSNEALPRAQVVGWSPDGRGVYVSFASRTQWERGILRYDRDTKRSRELVKDGRLYSGFRLARSGDLAVLSVADGNRPATLYVADGELRELRRLVDANPQLAARRLGRTELLAYLDADGHRKHGVVHYPVDYERGKAYPTVFIIYEEFFDDTFDPVANILNANGYVVVKPSVDFDIGYPGEAWVKGVSGAANKLIEMGVADSARLGVHGTSYGGYATNLLITQTGRFKAAINISGKVDLVSFYTDSPRLGVRNIHAAEKSQDRIGATLWQQPQKYVQHSAVMFADRIQTPLLLITGAQDFNVPADNTREMYYALRRLGKEVVWVNYLNGGHGGGNATAAEFLDMQRRIVAWYDAKLKVSQGKVAVR